MAADWFRTPDWDDAAQDDFEVRLRRAWAHSRPQYLRIKALSLLETGLRPAAQGLLLRLIEEYPDAFDVYYALEKLGDLAAEEGRLEEAIQRYHQVLELTPNGSGTTGTVQISIGEALVRLGRHEEALRALDEADEDATTFNSSFFRYQATLAEAAAGLEDARTARTAARAALGVLTAPDQFSRHPGVGRARADQARVRRLWAFANTAAGP